MTSQLKRSLPEGVSDSGQEKKRRTSLATSTADHVSPSVQTQPASSGDNGERQQKRISATGTQGAVYKAFEKRVLVEHDLRYFNYPRPVSTGTPCDIKQYGQQYNFTKGNCFRCDRKFDTTFATRERCNFHTKPSRRYGGRQHPHDCCGRGLGSQGCRTAQSHVHRENWYLDVKDFKRTDVVEDNHEVYAMDTESIHAVKGLEVAKVSVVNTSCDVVYEEKCLPTTEIIDYNTIWSGLRESDFSGVTKTFSEMQQDLLNMISPNTILVGHGLGTDLMALKIVHNKAVDTVQLYPHPRGLPRKKSLKDLAEEQLRISIQVGDGHDSRMDAEVAMKLALKKLALKNFGI